MECTMSILATLVAISQNNFVRHHRRAVYRARRLGIVLYSQKVFM